MAGSRTLKLSILADVDNLSKNLSAGSKDVETFGDKLGKWSKAAVTAFAAVGAAAAVYAGKLAVDGIKAAIADEAAQEKLATTLRNVAGATDSTIASTEKFILSLELATGRADDELRPALDRLVRSGMNVEQAQSTLKTALDVSSGSGKSLEATVNAIAKSYEGSNTALGKLGVGLSQTELKTMSFDDKVKYLAATFKDQANIQAETFQGKMARVKIAFDEAKESLGAQLLPVIETFADYVLKTVVPAVQKWMDENGPKLVKTLKEDVIPTIGSLVTALATIVSWIVDNKDLLLGIGETLLVGLAAFKVTTAIGTIVTALQGLATAYGAAATAATVAGTTTATAATAAATAASTAGGWALLATRLSGVATIVTGLVIAFEKIATNPKIIALVENKNVEKVLPGLGLTGATNYDTNPAGPAKPAGYVGNPNLKNYLNYPAPIVPTVKTPAEIAAEAAAKAAADIAKAEADRVAKKRAEDENKIWDAMTDIWAAQSSVNATLDKVTALSAQAVALMAEIDRNASGTTVIVNGAIDAEGTARTIYDVLRDSASRTGNYSNLGIAPLGLSVAI